MCVCVCTGKLQEDSEQMDRFKFTQDGGGGAKVAKDSKRARIMCFLNNANN